MSFVLRIGARRSQPLLGQQLKLGHYFGKMNKASIATFAFRRRWKAAELSSDDSCILRGIDCPATAKVQYRYNSSGGTKKMTGEEQHQLFQEQLLELEQERTNLFGTNESVDPTSNTIETNVGRGISSVSDTETEIEPRLTIDEMNKDREATYNFSKEEKNAWTNTDANHSFDPGYLDMIEKAREAKAEYEQSLKGEVEKHMKTLTQEGHFGDVEETNENSNKGDDKPKSVGTGAHANEYFTHLNEKGDEVSMVDVGGKEITRRTAVARTSVYFPPEVMDAFGIIDTDGKNEMIGKKGPIFSTARLAGIMGAKRTSDLIPLCHPLPLDKVHVDIRLEGNRAIIECECRVTHKTGVEMEALAGASIAALTIYDMVKAVSHRVRIETTELVTKTGGKRDVSNP